VARATAQAELHLSGLAALFDGDLTNSVVMPQEARRALRQLLPTLRESQRHQLASALFGDEPTSLSAVLHQLTLFADPPALDQAWMAPALRRLAALVEKRHGSPLHCALIRFFKLMDESKDSLLDPDEFVRGFQEVGAYDASGDDEVPLLDASRLIELFKVIDANGTGTVSFLELLLALGDRPGRPDLPEFPALEGAVPALLFVHKVALLRICRALDPSGQGRISVENFLELVSALASVVGRPLSEATREVLVEELRGEDLAYVDALASFEVFADGEYWQCHQTGGKAFPVSTIKVV